MGQFLTLLMLLVFQCALAPLVSAAESGYPFQFSAHLLEPQVQTFSEPISARFIREGVVFSRHIYRLEKMYLGPSDDQSLLWWRKGDDIALSTPWKVISANLKTMEILAGDEAGEGLHIGTLIRDGGQVKIRFETNLKISKAEQKIYLSPSPNLKKAITCPLAAGCDFYLQLYGALAGFDYDTLGEVGPLVAKDVVRPSTAVKLVKSYLYFGGSVDDIRDDYLIPVLKMIRLLKKLDSYESGDRDVYLRQSRLTYSTMIITSLETGIKTQKLIPEMSGSLIHTGAGIGMAYAKRNHVESHILNTVVDAQIGRDQPDWFKELCAPLIREVGVTTLDIVLNHSNEALDARVKRLIALEANLKDAIYRLCIDTKGSKQNECLAALAE